MGWAAQQIEKLRRGETVTFRPVGGSMSPLVESGELVTVEPVTGALAVGDIVLCLVGRAEYLHLVKELRDDEVLIGNGTRRHQRVIRTARGQAFRVARSATRFPLRRGRLLPVPSTGIDAERFARPSRIFAALRSAWSR